jgi:hypothetical protein
MRHWRSRRSRRTTDAPARARRWLGRPCRAGRSTSPGSRARSRALDRPPRRSVAAERAGADQPLPPRQHLAGERIAGEGSGAACRHSRPRAWTPRLGGAGRRGVTISLSSACSKPAGAPLTATRETSIAAAGLARMPAARARAGRPGNRLIRRPSVCSERLSPGGRRSDGNRRLAMLATVGAAAAPVVFLRRRGAQKDSAHQRILV